MFRPYILLILLPISTMVHAPESTQASRPLTRDVVSEYFPTHPSSRVVGTEIQTYPLPSILPPRPTNATTRPPVSAATLAINEASYHDVSQGGLPQETRRIPLGTVVGNIETREVYFYPRAAYIQTNNP